MNAQRLTPSPTSPRPESAFAIVTRRLPEAVERTLGAMLRCRFNRDDVPLDKTALQAAVAEADILVPTVTDRLDADVIAAASPRLRLIASFGVGVDHLDLAACRGRGILVGNTPDALTEETADLAMALILAGPRGVCAGDRLIRAGGWAGWGPTRNLGRRVYGKHLGILGMGRIGTAVARRARGFGMHLSYHGRTRKDAAWEAEMAASWYPDLDSMLRDVDVLSIHCPRTSATEGLLDARRLGLMRREAWLINTSRGEVVEEAALIRALRDGTLGGAGLDVFVNEPDIDPAFLTLENMVLAPHLGSATLETRTAMGEQVIENIRAFLDGRSLPTLV